MAALHTLAGATTRKPAWMDDVDVLREEVDRDRAEQFQAVEDFDHARRYANVDGDGGDQ